MEFTKGEWKTEYRKHSDGKYSQDIFDMDGETIATCNWHRVATFNGFTTDREANAHLISAAPDMYEALKYIRANGVGYAANLIDKAIAKAEGK